MSISNFPDEGVTNVSLPAGLQPSWLINVATQAVLNTFVASFERDEKPLKTTDAHPQVTTGPQAAVNES